MSDASSGDVVCTNCGLVQEERYSEFQATFDESDRMITNEFSKDEFFDNKLLSTVISSKFTKHPPTGLMRRIQMQSSINQKEVYRTKEFEVIERLCQHLYTTDHISTDAKHFFKDLCQRKIYRGVNRKAMMGCCIIRSLSKNNLVRDLNEVSIACDVPKHILTKNINSYEKLVGTKILREGRCNEIYRYLQLLGISGKEVFRISNAVIKKQQILMQDDDYQGKSPKIIIAMILKDMKFEKKAICYALNVSVTAF